METQERLINNLCLMPALYDLDRNVLYVWVESFHRDLKAFVEREPHVIMCEI